MARTYPRFGASPFHTAADWFSHAVIGGLDRSSGSPFLFPSARRPGRPLEGPRGAWGRIGGDGHGILVRLDRRAEFEAWTALDLLAVARARAAAEDARHRTPRTLLALGYLNLAASFEAERSGAGGGEGIGYQPGNLPSPYPWTVAAMRGRILPMCSDPAGREAGVTFERLLIVLDQLYSDACARYRHDARLRASRQHAAAALAAEVTRVVRLRDGFEG